MRVAVNVVAGFGRFRREVHLGVVDIDSTPDVQIFKLLEEYLSKYRVVKALVPFSPLNPSCRKDVYDKAAIYYVEIGGESLACFFCSRMCCTSLRFSDR